MMATHRNLLYSAEVIQFQTSWSVTVLMHPAKVEFPLQLTASERCRLATDRKHEDEKWVSVATKIIDRLALLASKEPPNFRS